MVGFCSLVLKKGDFIMKSLLITATLVLNLLPMSLHAQQTQLKMEVGQYIGTDVESGTLNADLTLKADGSLIFKLKSPDFEVPEPGCTGQYIEQGEFLMSDVVCPLDFLPTAKVKMDITNVSHDSVRTADGAIVPVYVDALGDEPIAFKMKIVE